MRVSGGLFAFGSYTAFCATFLVQEVQGDLAEQGEDSRRVAGPHAGFVFTEYDVQPPVQTVFDRPVGADDSAEFLHVVLQAGDVITRLASRLTILCAFADHHSDTAQGARPGFLYVVVE